MVEIENSDILALQIQALYKSAPASLLSVVGGMIALWVYWDPRLHTGLLAWFAVVAATATIHLISAAVRYSEWGQHWTALQWSRLVTGIYLSSGSCWGVGCAFLLLSGNDQQAIVSCCLLMGAVTVTFPAAVYTPAYNVFQIPALTIIAGALAFSSLDYGLILAAAALMLCAAMAIIARGVGLQLVLALTLSEENRRLVDKLEEANRVLLVESTTDPLTGLANRRHMMSFVRGLTGPCGLLIIDVDLFKSYNDSFGHAEGDVCLKLVAETLGAAVRADHDLVARQGGEEFVVVLRNLSLAVSHEQAEIIRKRIEALHTHRPSELRRRVTVSIGLAWRRDHDVSLVDLMRDADEAVYLAKRNGRNRVCVAGEGHRKAQVA